MSELFGIALSGDNEDSNFSSEKQLLALTVGSKEDFEKLLEEYDLAETAEEREKISEKIDSLFQEKPILPAGEDPPVFVPTFSTPADVDQVAIDTFDLDENEETISEKDDSAELLGIPVDEFAFWSPPTQDPTPISHDNINPITPSLSMNISEKRTDFSPKSALLEKMNQKQKKYALAAAGIITVFMCYFIMHHFFSNKPVQTPTTIIESAPKIVISPKIQPVTLVPSDVKASCPSQSAAVENILARAHVATAWICYRSHNIDGQIATFTFDDPVIPTAVTFTPGWNAVMNGEDQWLEYRHPVTLLWRSGGKKFLQHVIPTRAPVTYQFPQKRVTQKIILTILFSQEDKNSRIIFHSTTSKNAFALSHLTIRGFVQEGEIK